MNRQPVTSTNLVAVGFDPRSNTLEVEFHSARVYQYRGVPQAVYENLKEAESKGRFFNANIRSSYPYVRVR